MALAAVSFLLAACSGHHKAKPVTISWKEGQTTAVARLGYYDSFKSFEESDTYEDLCAVFPWIREANRLTRTGDAGPLTLVIHREGVKPFLLFGTEDIPCGDEVLDISLPVPEPAWSYDQCSYPEFNIDAEIVDGCPYVIFRHEDLISSYTDEIKIPEGRVSVSGLEGFAKGIFIADIGQDLNPVLCVLTAEGKVKICCLLEAIKSGRCSLSGTLEGLSGINGFASGLSADKDYTTIYAVDSWGKRNEIPLFVASNHYYSMLDNGEKIDAYFSQDWHMTVNRVSENGVTVETHSGIFSQSGSIEDVLTLSYIVNDNGRFDKGEAVVSYLDNSTDYLVKVSGALELPEGTVFRSGYGPEMISDYGGEYEEAYQ